MDGIRPRLDHVPDLLHRRPVLQPLVHHALLGLPFSEVFHQIRQHPCLRHAGTVEESGLPGEKNGGLLVPDANQGFRLLLQHGGHLFWRWRISALENILNRAQNRLFSRGHRFLGRNTFERNVVGDHRLLHLGCRIAYSIFHVFHLFSDRISSGIFNLLHVRHVLVIFNDFGAVSSRFCLGLVIEPSLRVLIDASRERRQRSRLHHRGLLWLFGRHHAIPDPIAPLPALACVVVLPRFSLLGRYSRHQGSLLAFWTAQIGEHRPIHVVPLDHGPSPALLSQLPRRLPGTERFRNNAALLILEDNANTHRLGIHGQGLVLGTLAIQNPGHHLLTPGIDPERHAF